MRLTVASVLAACAATLVAQTPPVTILEIEVDNTVLYMQNVGDQPKIATSPGIVALPAEAQRAFKWVGGFGDIVAVNGRPAKGSWTGRFLMFYCQPTYTPGRMIADITCGCSHDELFSITYPDGTPIGTIMTFGYGASPPSPGAPNAVAASNTTVVGGTGAFLGARGQAGWARAGEGVPYWRWASMLEDPANRRANGGSKMRHIIHLIPMSRPEVLSGATGSAVFHGNDFSPVTPDSPARAGELLVVSATSLGPVRPNLDPGKPFPAWAAGKEHVVNSPVDVTVNGKATQVVSAIGWPGGDNVYRVDFRVPEGTAAGTATLSLSVAWISGPEVKIPVK